MGFARLLALATGMAVATLLAAFAPLVVHLSPRTLSSISELSVGILVGAALSIILPEGVAAVFENSSHDDGDHDDNATWIGAALLSGFLLMCVHSLLPRARRGVERGARRGKRGGRESPSRCRRPPPPPRPVLALPRPRSPMSTCAQVPPRQPSRPRRVPRPEPAAAPSPSTPSPPQPQRDPVPPAVARAPAHLGRVLAPRRQRARQ